MRNLAEIFKVSLVSCLVVLILSLFVTEQAQCEPIPSVKNPIIEFLKVKEGYRSVAYLDAAQVWTIGYGHTENVFAGQKINREIAEEYLKYDTRRFEKYVWEKANRILRWYQFGALVSFCYNLGYRLKGGLLNGIRTGNDAKVTYKIKLYIYAGGRVLTGLVKRRKEEAKFYIGDKAIIEKYSTCHTEPVERAAGVNVCHTFDRLSMTGAERVCHTFDRLSMTIMRLCCEN